MGAFDTVIVGHREGQVKCWGRHMRTYTVGDRVPNEVRGALTYSIVMKEGGFVNVKRLRIENWSGDAGHRLVIDKYGKPFDGDEKYFYAFWESETGRLRLREMLEES